MNFPTSEVKIKACTVAYNAERELDNILYNDTGMYRLKQFSNCETITLKTTFEEISILWKEEAKFRPHFKADSNTVIVPNIFAKICGVKDNDVNNYFRLIQQMITENTILIKKLPYIDKNVQNVFYSQSYKFIDKGRLNIKEIKNCKDYKYNFLRENVQDFILNKIQEMINLELILSEDLSLNQKIVATILNLDNNILRIIQQYDFTKEIPKIILIDVDENSATLQDCILLVFFNLIGFDIAIYTPTGYQNIEKYIRNDLIEDYQIGNYMYNLIIPKYIKKNKKRFNHFFR